MIYSGNGYLKKWSSHVLDRVASLPTPYRSSFEDWLQQQTKVGQLDARTLKQALDALEPDSQSGLISCVEELLRLTEKKFG